MRLPASLREQAFRRPLESRYPSRTDGKISDPFVHEGQKRFEVRAMRLRREAHLVEPTHYHVERLLDRTIIQQRIEVRKADAERIAECYAYSGHSNAGAGNGAGVDDGTPTIKVRACHYGHVKVTRSHHGQQKVRLECTGKQ